MNYPLRLEHGRFRPYFIRWFFGIFTALLLLTDSVVAQTTGAGRVQGRVFNPATGEYVRNAEIRVQGTDRITYSEEGGSYVLENVPAGTATITVTFSGYQTATAPI